tara:strand:- start:114 stop:1310 length:1197 start_codon:yes stop_codon:yes gene_type:complete
MKVGIFIDDFFDDRGFNSEIKYYYNLLNNYEDIDLYVYNFGKNYKSQKNIINISGNTLLKLFKLISYMKTFNSVTVVNGIMGKNQIIIYIALLISQKKFISISASQVTKYNLENKLFYEDPDISSLTLKKELFNNRKLLIKRIAPVLKKIYLKTIGYLVIKRASRVIHSSNFEKIQFKRLVKIKSKSTILFPPNMPNDKVEAINNYRNDNYYKKFNLHKKINIIYWGRIDYSIKGLDRILYALHNTNNKKLIIHFMGPNYNDGLKNLLKLKSDLSLNNMIIHPKDEWLGNISPFINADYSILSSRWDGFPRSLRESLEYQVPIICSIETNFADICRKFQCGISFKNKNELIKIFNNVSKSESQNLKRNCYNASSFLDGERYKNNIRFILQETYESSRT